jgi:type I site-specific restriction-modification system R (restriction) subunit
MLNFQFPSYSFRIRGEASREVWDIVRNKWVALTPEEFVRQHAIHFFIHDLNFPNGRIGVETEVVFHGMKRRADLVLYTRGAFPLLIAEFKAPTVKIEEAVLSQTLRYNSVLKAPWLFISNGHEHALCEVNSDTGTGKWHAEAAEWKFIQ